MAVANVQVKGGTKTAAYLAKLGDKMTGTVRVGFLEGATYPAQTKDANALLKGLDKLNSTGPFQPGGKPSRARDYRKAKKIREAELVGPASPSTVLPVAQAAFWDEFGTATSPPRPFMRETIAREQAGWGPKMAAVAVAARFNGALILRRMGEGIRDQFVTAIKRWPADNAPLTVAIKGFNKGLVHSGVMARSVDYEVKEK